MGVFHCPFGCPFYDDESCIDCGLCLATTQDEMIEASKKVREYLKTHVKNKGLSKKIIVCGKGGVGKSTMVVLIARAIVNEGYYAMVLDTDESNPGLYRLFQIETPPKPLITLLSRFGNGGMQPDNWLKRDKILIEDIPQEYVSSQQGFRFLMTGKIENPFQGCACSMADITRDLIGNLVLQEKETILVDSEAGVESFGRGVERNADTILIIVEPSFESMALAGKINYMAEGMGIQKVWAILNKVPSIDVEQKMTTELAKNNLRTIGTVYIDPTIISSSFVGSVPTTSKAQEQIITIVRKLFTIQ